MNLILINNQNNQLNLLFNSHFKLTKCEALHGVDTDIQEVTSPYLDGSIIEGVRTLPRGISLTFKLIPDIKNSIDYFMSFVKSKQYVTLQETENGNTITIKGVATIPPYSRMMAMCEIQLDIYCSQPYWEDLNQVTSEISMFVDLLNFPMATGQYFTAYGRPFGTIDVSSTATLVNNGDVSTGMNIKITALGQTSNPCVACQTGDQNGWYMYLDLTLNANDEIEINTVRGNKYIKINGSETYNGQPVLNYLHFTGTDWLQLEVGENTFNVGSYSQGSIIPTDNMYFMITYKRRYE